MSTVSIRLNETEKSLFENYAKLTGKSLSSLFKEALANEIEDRHDLETYYKALKEYQEDPVTISHEELKKELGL